MTTLTLTPTKLSNAIWHGVLHQSGQGVPTITVTHLDTEIPDVKLTEDPGEGHWLVEIPIPSEAVADGVQVFVISDAVNGEKLGNFTLIAGEVLDDDIRAEVELLRAELDMLKRAFRRHCVETT